MNGRLRIATRGSELARWQAAFVARRLSTEHPGLSVELVVVETLGDRRLDVPVWAIGGQGVFVKEVQQAVLDGRADVAVHSAKDLPSATAPGLVLAAVPVRDDPRDALVGCTLEGLPVGAEVATGSVRRRAQLAWLRPDLTFAGLRGNMATRLSQVGRHHAVVVAAAALQRLGLTDRAAQVLPPAMMLPQVGQGALGIECRADDQDAIQLLVAIDDGRARRAVEAERGFLAVLGGGCDLPVAAHATEESDGALTIEGMLASGDGRIMLRASRSGRPEHGPAGDGSTLGSSLAEYLLADAGGDALLAGLGSR